MTDKPQAAHAPATSAQVDVSKLHAAVDKHVQTADQLRAQLSHLALENHDLHERLAAAEAANPEAAPAHERHIHNIEAQKEVDDLAAKLDASSGQMAEATTAHQAKPSKKQKAA